MTDILRKENRSISNIEKAAKKIESMKNGRSQALEVRQ